MRAKISSLASIDFSSMYSQSGVDTESVAKGVVAKGLSRILDAIKLSKDDPEVFCALLRFLSMLSLWFAQKDYHRVFAELLLQPGPQEALSDTDAFEAIIKLLRMDMHLASEDAVSFAKKFISLDKKSPFVLFAFGLYLGRLCEHDAAVGEALDGQYPGMVQEALNCGVLDCFADVDSDPAYRLLFTVIELFDLSEMDQFEAFCKAIARPLARNATLRSHFWASQDQIDPLLKLAIDRLPRHLEGVLSLLAALSQDPVGAMSTAKLLMSLEKFSVEERPDAAFVVDIADEYEDGGHSYQVEKSMYQVLSYNLAIVVPAGTMCTAIGGRYQWKIRWNGWDFLARVLSQFKVVDAPVILAILDLFGRVFEASSEASQWIVSELGRVNPVFLDSAPCPLQSRLVELLQNSLLPSSIVSGIFRLVSSMNTTDEQVTSLAEWQVNAAVSKFDPTSADYQAVIDYFNLPLLRVEEDAICKLVKRFWARSSLNDKIAMLSALSNLLLAHECAHVLDLFTELVSIPALLESNAQASPLLSLLSNCLVLIPLFPSRLIDDLKEGSLALMGRCYSQQATSALFDFLAAWLHSANVQWDADCTSALLFISAAADPGSLMSLVLAAEESDLSKALLKANKDRIVSAVKEDSLCYSHLLVLLSRRLDRSVDAFVACCTILTPTVEAMWDILISSHLPSVDLLRLLSLALIKRSDKKLAVDHLTKACTSQFLASVVYYVSSGDLELIVAFGNFLAVIFASVEPMANILLDQLSVTNMSMDLLTEIADATVLAKRELPLVMKLYASFDQAASSSNALPDERSLVIWSRFAMVTWSVTSDPARLHLARLICARAAFDPVGCLPLVALPLAKLVASDKGSTLVHFLRFYHLLHPLIGHLLGPGKPLLPICLTKEAFVNAFIESESLHRLGSVLLESPDNQYLWDSLILIAGHCTEMNGLASVLLHHIDLEQAALRAPTTKLLSFITVLLQAGHKDNGMLRILQQILSNPKAKIEHLEAAFAALNLILVTSDLTLDGTITIPTEVLKERVEGVRLTKVAELIDQYTSLK